MNPNGNPSSLRPPWGPGNPPPISPGRPRKRPLSEAYEDWLRQAVDRDTIVKLRSKGIRVPTDATNADMVAMSQGREAISGKTNAAREMREAVEGKAMQRIELSRPEDRSVEFSIVYANAMPNAMPLMEALKEHRKEIEETVALIKGAGIEPGTPIEIVNAPAAADVDATTGAPGSNTKATE